MGLRPDTPPALLARVCRLAGVIALGALLAGCDRCGDWFWTQHSDQPLACRQQAPKPQ
jgi:hypothetical protein